MSHRRQAATQPADKEEEFQRKISELRSRIEELEDEKAKMVNDKKQRQFQLESYEALVKKREADVKDERTRREAAERQASIALDNSDQQARKVYF